MASVAALLLVPFAQGGGAAQAAPSWNDEVRPILAEHCFACHGPDPASRAADLRLDTEPGLLGEGGGPAAVDRGAPLDSELWYRVTTDVDFDAMPPPGAGEGPSEEELDVLRRWLEAGAPWESHWAYAPGRPAPPPATDDPRARSPIDAFVAARLAAEGLHLAEDAPPRELARRVHLDLTGLPPSPERVAAFERDPSDAAYAAMVDELLGSVAHAEHWARHWLDIARYADSHGYTIDSGRSVWPWRDWVVRSIHRDQPFDAFTVEQLAGDLLPGATREQRVATGFHRNTQVNQEGGAKDEENRINAVIDRVATTGSVWLGTTMGCAQCHTHKFDPVTQTEYFGLFAYFNSTTDGGVSAEPSLLVPSNDREEAEAAAWEARLAELEAELVAARDASSRGWTPWQPPRATGTNGPELRPEEDGTYRVLGQGAVYSTYVLEGPAPLPTLRALRLEALPEGGPGRGKDRTFLLQEVRLAAWLPGADGSLPLDDTGSPVWTPLPLGAARATRAVDGGGAEVPAAALLDRLRAGDEGWSVGPGRNEPEALELTLAAAASLPEGARLRVELRQEAGGSRALGRFRALVGAAPPEADATPVSDAWRAARQALDLHRRMRPRLATTLVLEERRSPRTTRRFERGSFLDPREVVTPHVPAALDRVFEGQRAPADRLGFARWLVDPRNALVRRVTVNRWWQQLFGRGLVATEDDFGLRGARPTHPELLEWLAGELLERGWSRRALLREIVLSSTYRQARVADEALRSRDPENTLLARARLRRLPGEALRDAMLVASDTLVATPFGPPVEPPQPEGVYAFTQSRKDWKGGAGDQRYRRSLYTRLWRSAPYPFFTTFDAPSPASACTRRGTSRTPLQALTLMNDPQVMELARALALRLDAEVGRDGEVPDAARIAAAFRWCLQREPAAEELERVGAFVAAARARDGERPAWNAVARALFNLGEFTHRP